MNDQDRSKDDSIIRNKSMMERRRRSMNPDLHHNSELPHARTDSSFDFWCCLELN